MYFPSQRGLFGQARTQRSHLGADQNNRSEIEQGGLGLLPSELCSENVIRVG